MDEKRTLVEGTSGELIWATEEDIKRIKEFKLTHPNGYTKEELEKMRQQREYLLKDWGKDI